jgi:hypothetical protein
MRERGCIIITNFFFTRIKSQISQDHPFITQDVVALQILDTKIWKKMSVHLESQNNYSWAARGFNFIRTFPLVLADSER